MGVVVGVLEDMISLVFRFSKIEFRFYVYLKFEKLKIGFWFTVQYVFVLPLREIVEMRTQR